MIAEASLTVSPLTVVNMPQVGNVDLSEISVQLTTSHRSLIKVAATVTASQADNKGVFANIIGKTTVINASGTFFPSTHRSTSLGDFDIQNLSFKLHSDLANINMTAELRDANRLMLTAPITIDYLVTNEALAVMGATTENYAFEVKSL